MSEDIFLLIYGLAFGLPLVLAAIVFSVIMFNHNKEMDKSMDEINRIKEEREARYRGSIND